MYIFSIPDSETVRQVNQVLLGAFVQNREWFYDDFVIETAYGCPPCCIWNGTRPEWDVPYRKDQIKNIIDMYGGLNIRYRLTFTNYLVRPEHMYDTYGNFIARVCNDAGDCYVTLANECMAEHIRKNYPNLKICWSTTTIFEKGIDSINQLSKDSIVVLPYMYNNDFNSLLLLQHPNNIEVLVNEKCIDCCPRRREHGDLINRFILMEVDEEAHCFFEKGPEFADIPRHHQIPRNKLAEYATLGINHFKIEGRSNDLGVMKAYKEYFIRPENLNDFKEYYDYCVREFINKE